jgi:hypothetical protein
MPGNLLCPGTGVKMHKVARRLAAVAVGVTCALSTVTPANAWVGLFQDANYGGGSWYTSLGYNPNLHNERYENNGVIIGDTVTSLRNRFGWWTCFYEHANYGGANVGYPAYTDAPDLFRTGFNNRISSFRAC